MDFGGERGVVIDTSPFTKAVFFLEGGFWWSIVAVFVDDQPIGDSGRELTGYRDSELQEFADTFAELQTEVYRDALGSADSGAFYDAMRFAAGKCLPYLTGKHADDYGSQKQGMPASSRLGSLSPAEAAAILGVDLTASLEAVNAAYRVRARLVHPDRLAGASEAAQKAATETMQQLNDAVAIMRVVAAQPRTETRPVREPEPVHEPHRETPSATRTPHADPYVTPASTSPPSRRRGVKVAALVALGVVAAGSLVAKVVANVPDEGSASTSTQREESLAGTCWRSISGSETAMEQVACDSSTAEYRVNVGYETSAQCPTNSYLESSEPGELFWCLTEIPEPASASDLLQASTPTPTPEATTTSTDPYAGNPSNLTITRVDFGAEADLVVDLLTRRALAINAHDYGYAFAYFTPELAASVGTSESWGSDMLSESVSWSGFDLGSLHTEADGQRSGIVTITRYRTEGGARICTLQYKTYTFRIGATVETTKISKIANAAPESPCDPANAPASVDVVQSAYTPQDNLVARVLESRALAINAQNYDFAYSYFSPELAAQVGSATDWGASLRAENAYWQGFLQGPVVQTASGEYSTDITIYRHQTEAGVDTCNAEYKKYVFELSVAYDTASITDVVDLGVGSC